MKKLVSFTIALFILLNSYADTYTTSKDLNIRSGPGAKYEIIGKLYQGDALEVTDISGNWGKVQFENKEGYVNVKYLQPTSENAELSAPPRKEKMSNITAYFIIAGLIVLLFILRKTAPVRRYAPHIAYVLSIFDKDKSGTQLGKYRCKSCGKIMSGYYAPSETSCEKSRSHDWRRID